jgi:TRAP-type C4-dicarboxylate transport system substrate-binding protein
MGQSLPRTLVRRTDPTARRIARLAAACRAAAWRLTAGCAVAAQLAAAQAQEPVTLRFATFLPPNGIFTGSDGVIARWSKAIERDSGGLVKVEILPGGTLGAAGRNPGAQLKLVTDGVTDASFIIPSTTPGRFPDDNLFGLPVTRSALEGSIAFARLHQAGLMRGYDDKSFQIIGLVVNPPNTLHSRAPINRLEDMAGKRFQASGTEQQDLLRALGGVPVGTVSVREVAEAISRGVVDGTPKDWIALHSFRIADAAKHHVDIPLGASTIMIAMNRARFDGLPPKAQEAIRRHSGEAFSRLAGEMFDARLKLDRERTAADKDHVIVTLPPEERVRWDAATAKVVEAWRKEDPRNEKLWAEFNRIIEQVRTEAKEGGGPKPGN